VPFPKLAIVFIFITWFLDIFGIGVVIPVLPKLVEQPGLPFFGASFVSLLAVAFARRAFHRAGEVQA